MKEKLLKIINNYGVSHQLKHLYTEMYEFTEAVFEYDNFKDDFTYDEKEYKDHILEEFADIEILLSQFKIYYNLSQKDINKIKLFKIKRQLGRMEKENEGRMENY